MVVQVAERFPAGDAHVLDLIESGNERLLAANGSFPERGGVTFRKPLGDA
jgi:DNA-directed RNA polymerase sigma subunit (sigma70/sigma32)